MEALKVGRPSTYQNIIENVIERNYIVKESRKGEKKTMITLEIKPNVSEIKETSRLQVCGMIKNKFFPTDIGIALEAFIKEHFGHIFNYEFSKEMENSLKRIETGELVWHEIVSLYYNSFQPIVDKLEVTMTAFTSPGKSLSDKRHVGTLPDGREAYAYVTKNGPAVQILTPAEVKDAEAGQKVKGKFVSLDNKNLINKITIEDVMRLIQLPMVLGQLEGKDIIVKKGPHGIYINHDGANYNCRKTLLESDVEDDGSVEESEVGGLSLSKVIAYIESSKTDKKNNVIKLIENGKNVPIRVMNGKFGPFFIMNKTIVSIPESVNPVDLTLPVCKALLDNKKQYKTEKKPPAASKQKASAAKSKVAPEEQPQSFSSAPSPKKMTQTKLPITKSKKVKVIT
jgi:DNA topoisomerase-1